MSQIIEPYIRQPGPLQDWLEVLIDQAVHIHWPSKLRDEDEIRSCCKMQQHRFSVGNMHALTPAMLSTLRSRSPGWARLEQGSVTTEVGCPYCIVGGFNFRKMIKNSYGEYVCPGCGHVDYPRVECRCDRCQQKRNSREHR